jgi:hypothetical protein
MQPIETNYKGFRFRSRSEARWAVFLDTIQISWRYEEQGFDLNGTGYLPDFWVPDWNAWVEIKGPKPTPEEIDKCRLLSEASGKLVLLVSGDPWIEGERKLYDVMLFSKPEDHRHMSEGWEFGEGRRNSREIWLVSDDLGAFTLNSIPHDGDHKYPLSGSYAYTIVEGLKAARGARFEHGESGAP